MQPLRSHLRVVAPQTTDHPRSAGSLRGEPNRNAHTPEAPLLVVLGVLLIAALSWVLWGVRLVAQGGPSGLGVPPAEEEQPLDPRVKTSEPVSGER